MLNRTVYLSEELKDIVLKTNDPQSKITKVFNDFIKEIWGHELVEYFCQSFASAFSSNFISDKYKFIFKIEEEKGEITFKYGFEGFNGKEDGYNELEKILIRELEIAIESMDFIGYLKIMAKKLCEVFENAMTLYADYLKEIKKNPTVKGLQTYALAILFGERALEIYKPGD